jgi:hypothetical protein
MTSPYLCETCTHPDENPNKCPCPLNDLKLERKIIEVGELCGLACHSDFQNQKERIEEPSCHTCQYYGYSKCPYYPNEPEVVDAARTNLKYPPCCYGEFDCIDEGKRCIHKNNCKKQRKEGEH